MQPKKHSLSCSRWSEYRRFQMERQNGDKNKWRPQTDLELNARLSHGAEGVGLPVDLLHLLPHHHVEAGRVLVAEDEAGVVVVRDGVHVERPLEIHTAEGRVPFGEDGRDFNRQVCVRSFDVFYTSCVRLNNLSICSKSILIFDGCKGVLKDTNHLWDYAHLTAKGSLIGLNVQR